MAIYKKEKDEPEGISDSVVPAVCPWCRRALKFEFSHNHTFNTTSKLVNIEKLGGEKPKIN